MKLLIMIIGLLTAGYLPLRHYAVPALRAQIGWAFYFCVVSTIVVAAYAPHPLVLAGWCILLPNIGVQGRVALACRYVMLIPLVPSMAPLILIGGHVIAYTPLIDMVGLGTLIAIACGKARGATPPGLRGITAEDALVIILFLIFSIGSTRFTSVSLTLRGLLVETMTLAIPFWILRRTIHTRKELQLVIACLAVPAVMITMLAVYEARSGWIMLDAIEARFMGDGYLARSATTRGGLLRAAGTLNTAIECGLFLLMGLFALLTSRAFFRTRLAWLAATGLCLLGMLASQSRGAVLGLVVGVIVMLLARRRFFAAGLMVFGELAALGALELIARTPGRIAAFLHPPSNGAFLDYRTLLLRRGLEEGRKHPWFGLPGEEVLKHLKDMTQGEQIIDLVNSYLHIFLISGIVGLGAAVLAILFIYRDLFVVVMRSKERRVQADAAFFISTFTAMLLSLATVSFYGRIPWFIMFMAAGARVLIRTLPRRVRIRPGAERIQPVYAAPVAAGA